MLLKTVIETVLLSTHNMVWLQYKHYQVCTLIWKAGQKFEGRLGHADFCQAGTGFKLFALLVGKEFKWPLFYIYLLLTRGASCTPIPI